MRKPMEDICQSGLFGPWDKPDLGEMPDGPQSREMRSVGPGFVPAVPQLRHPGLGAGLVSDVPLLADVVSTRHIFEGTLYFPQPRTPRERIAQELAAVSFKEYGLQDANTLEATQTMVESQAVDKFLLCDQEVLIRHLHKETAAWVDDYQRKTAGV